MGRLAQHLPAIVVPLAVLTAAHLLFLPHYEVCDDVGITMLARGVGYIDEPSPYLVFCNFALGQFLAALYHLAPGVPWYRVVMVLVQLAASLTIASITFARPVSVWRVALGLAYFLLFDLRFYVVPQFTVTAALPAIAAVMLWQDRSLRSEALRGRALGWFTVLLVLSALVRLHSCLLIGVLALPCTLLHGLAIWFGRREPATPDAKPPARLAQFWSRIGLPAVLGGLVLLTATSADKLGHWLHPGWREYHEVYAEVIPFVDHFFRYAEVKPLFDRVGWSENDYWMLRMYGYVDEQVFSTEKLREVRLGLPSRVPELSVRSWLEFVGGEWPFLTMLLVLAVFVSWEKKRLTHFATTVAWISTVAWLMEVLLRRLLERITDPMAAFCWCVVGVLGCAAPAARRRSWLYLVRVACLVWLLFVPRPGGPVWLGMNWLEMVKRMQAQSETAAVHNAELKEALRQLAPGPHQLYIVWGTSFPHEYLLPGDSLAELDGFRAIGIGAWSRSPLTTARLREFQIADPWRALYERENVFLIAQPAYNEVLIDYVREHHGQEIEVRKAWTYGPPGANTLWVYQFGRKEAQPP